MNCKVKEERHLPLLLLYSMKPTASSVTTIGLITPPKIAPEYPETQRNRVSFNVFWLKPHHNSELDLVFLSK